MLPTTGHFKNISCPFYDSCICERPYCHFKHSKRDTLNDTNLISELVSKAVHKVLNSNNHNNISASSPGTATATVAIDVAEEINESPVTSVSSDSSSGSVTYNPTPISELNKFKSNEIPERRNRHIPIQYTPEQPRSFRSSNTNINTSSSASNPLEYSVEISDSDNDPPGYSPSVNMISYIPSSIITCPTQTTPTTTILDTVSTTDTVTITETNSHQYVPFNLNFQDSQTSALTVEYNPTKNLSLDSPPSYSEYVPKYNDEFIDEFINDPNIYEPTEILTSIHNESPTKTKTIIETKQKSTQLSEEEKKTLNKNKNVENYSRSSSSRNSKQAAIKSKHRKDREKDGQIKNGYVDVNVPVNIPISESAHDKHKTSKSRNHSRRSRSKQSHSKSSSVQSTTRDKREVNIKNNHVKVKMRDNSKIKHKMKSSDGDQHSNSSLLLSESVTFFCGNHEDSIIESSDESDDELEQCKRIFEEYQPPADYVQIQIKNKSKPEATENETVSSKKRVAHEKSSKINRSHTVKHVVIKKAALVMANRYKQVLSNLDKKNHNQNPIEDNLELSEVSVPVDYSQVSVRKRPLNTTLQKATDDASPDFMSPNPAKLKRIAHVPNVSSLLSAKKKVEEISKTKSVPTTPMQTVAKGNKRIAHTPEVSIADVPIVLQSEKSKLPVNVRNRFLFLMIKECVKLYISKKAAYDREP